MMANCAAYGFAKPKPTLVPPIVNVLLPKLHPGPGSAMPRGRAQPSVVHERAKQRAKERLKRPRTEEARERFANPINLAVPPSLDLSISVYP